MMKINHSHWYVIIFADETLIFFTDYRLEFMSLQESCDLDLLYVNIILILQSHTMHLMNGLKISCTNNLKKNMYILIKEFYTNWILGHYS